MLVTRRVPLLLLAVTVACAPRVDTGAAPPSPSAGAGAGSAIDAAALREDLTQFASDAFRGREAGTPAEMTSARFIAGRLQALGLRPAGDSGYFHRVPMATERVTEASTFTVTRGGRTDALRVGDALVPLISLGEGVFARQKAEGDVVFAGYGVPDPATGRDDLASLNLRGKIVVVLMGAPAGADEATRRQLEGTDGLSMRLQRLIPMGPAGVVMLFGGAQGVGLFEQFAPGLMRSMTLATRAGQRMPPDEQRPIPMILLGRLDRAAALLPSQYPQDMRPQALPARFRGQAVTERTSVTGYNVVATLPGTDARLARTYVALGAHHDHAGMQPPVDGDSVANGADDDGSGSMGLLAVARSMATGSRPRRSVLFVWHTAEEKGLLGSSHFTENPTVPIDSIVAMINADMIGRNGGPTEDFASRGIAPSPDRLYLVGPGAAPNGQSRVLGGIVDSVNARQGRPFTIDREWDTPDHPERIYFRSDHYSYAQRGVPVIFFTTGLHEDYHKVSDEVEKIDFEKLGRVAALIRDVTMAVGNRPTRPH